eukprot:jgi/Tetstr1/446845/TSEL_034323.t1
MTHPLPRDLEWWVAVPSPNNGRSIYKPVEAVYMHVDSSGYGWGAVLIETTEARSFSYDGGRELHITDNELVTVRPRRVDRPSSAPWAGRRLLAPCPKIELGTPHNPLRPFERLCDVHFKLAGGSATTIVQASITHSARVA